LVQKTQIMRFSLISVIILLCCYFTSITFAVDCANIIAPDGSKYDLSALADSQMNGWEMDSYYYWWAPCTKVDKQCGRLDQPCRASGGMCQSWGGSPDVSPDATACIGILNEVRGLDFGEGVEVYYDRGDLDRYGILTIKCDINAIEPKDIHINSPPIIQDPYLIEFKSRHGCSTTLTGAWDTGSVIIFILILCIVLYVGLGFGWNKYKHQEISHPHKDFWTDTFVDHVKTGWTFVVSKVRRN